MDTRIRNLLIITVVLIVFISACAVEDESEPVVEPVVEPATEEPPTEEPPVEPSGGTNLELSLVVGGLLEQEIDVLVGQLDVFNAETGIMVLLTVLPGADLAQAVAAMAAAGDSPDVSMMPYNAVASFQQNDLLIALENYVDPGSFMPDSVASNTWNGSLYGMPWRRSACLPQYTNLGVYKATSYPDEAAFLANYLTDEQRQQMNLELLDWYPTRMSINICEPLLAKPIRPVAETVPIIVNEVQLIAEELGQPLNANLSTAAFAQDANVSPSGLAAAIAGVVDSESFTAALEQGALVGMMEVVDEMQLTDIYGELIPAGIYLVDVLGEGPQPQIIFYNDRQSYELGPDVEQFMEPTGAPVGQSFVYVEEGSFRVCFSLDSRRICVGFG